MGIENRHASVVGLGYVGLPLLLLLAEKGFKATGYDINCDLIEKLRKGESPFRHDSPLRQKLANYYQQISFHHDKSALKNADIIIVCVPTPVDSQNKPDLSALVQACANIASILKKGQLVIIESTIFPGTTEEIVLPLLQKPTSVVGKDFFLAHCPERIDPGNKQFHIANIPRVIAGMTPHCTSMAARFYQSLIDASITPLSSIKAAEATKMVENIFRDVNIALVNELAQSFDSMNIDILEVIKGASTKPFAFLPHYPGCGVGGHCIPVDPYYLIERARAQGYEHRFLSLARVINKEMPSYALKRAEEGLKEIGKTLSEARVALLGVTYKGDIEDTRESPALEIMELLEERGIEFDVYDPYVPSRSTAKNIDQVLINKDCAIIATNHSEFVQIPAEKFKQHGISVIIDGRNCLNKQEIRQAGIIYKGIGR